MYGRMRPIALEVEESSSLILDQDLLKAHCAVDGDSLDDLLAAYEAAAIAWAEGEMHRTLLARSHSFTVTDFPRFGRQEVLLPNGLCQAITGVQYSSNGNIETLSDYRSELGSENGGRLYPPRGTSWPSVDLDAPAPVVFNYTAGWETAAAIPANIKHALMFAVEDMLDVRGVTDLAALMAIAASGRTFDTRSALISRYVINIIY